MGPRAPRRAGPAARNPAARPPRDPRADPGDAGTAGPGAGLIRRLPEPGAAGAPRRPGGDRRDRRGKPAAPRPVALAAYLARPDRGNRRRRAAGRDRHRHPDAGARPSLTGPTAGAGRGPGPRGGAAPREPARQRCRPRPGHAGAARGARHRRAQDPRSGGDGGGPPGSGAVHRRRSRALRSSGNERSYIRFLRDRWTACTRSRFAKGFATWIIAPVS